MPVRLLTALILLAAVATAVGGTSIAGASSEPTDNAPQWASRAAWMTAAALRRGVNFGDMLDAPDEGAWGLKVQDEFVNVTAEAGFTAVRLPVRWSNHAGAAIPCAIDPQFFARVESIVDQLLAKGLYVVMDMHHYRQLDGDDLDEGEFSVDPGIVETRFLALWHQIAQRFRGKSERLLFELYNEPHGRLTPSQWNDLLAQALAVVRESNRRRIVVIGPTNWNGADALPSLRLPDDPNLIVTVHDYEPFDFTHQGADWVSPVPPVGVRCCTSSQEASAVAPLIAAKAWSDARHYPVFLGEFGAFSRADMKSRVAYTRFMREQAEARRIPWAYWELAAGFGVFDPVGHRWRAPLKAALLGN